ncbi:MAG: hypothetical protein ACI9XZ_004176 [Alphaproteobacteria bacterium]|jgi:hypothetical protein
MQPLGSSAVHDFVPVVLSPAQGASLGQRSSGKCSMALPVRCTIETDHPELSLGCRDTLQTGILEAFDEYARSEVQMKEAKTDTSCDAGYRLHAGNCA